MDKKIWAVRGATTITKDQPEQVLTATEELLLKIFELNQIENADIVSIFFSVTKDINSEFPAASARKIGITDTPLFCAQEIPKPGSLPLCIRVMIHFYTNLSKTEIKSVYLKNAIQLRPDLKNKTD